MRTECRLYLGERGFGKTLGMEVDHWGLIESRQVATVTFDVKGDYATRGATRCHTEGHPVYLDIARKADKMFGWPWDIKPTSDNPLEREIERETAVQAMGMVFAAKRNVKTLEDRPYIKKYLDAALRVWSSMPFPVPLWWLRKLFQPASAEYRTMVDRCGDREAAWMFEDVAARGVQSRKQYEDETGGTFRLIEAVYSVLLWGRHRHDSVRWIDLIKRKAHVFFDLSGVPPESARALTIAAYNAIINDLRGEFARTGRPNPCVLILEEIGMTGTCTPLLLDFMREGRGAGGAVWGVTQTAHDFGEIDAFKTFAGLCGEMHVFHMKSDVDLIGSYLAQPTFNPNAVLQSETRMAVDRYEAVPTHTRRLGHDGKEEGHTEGHSFRPVLVPVTRDTLKSPQVHQAEVERKISTLGIGQKLVRGMYGVEQVDVTPLGEIWPLENEFLPSHGMTLGQKRTLEAIDLIRSQECYKAPTEAPTPPPQPARKPPKQSTPKGQTQPKRGAASRSPRNGNGKS